MTNKVKNQVLKYFQNQKLFGFKYHEDVNLNLQSSCDMSLPNSLEALKQRVDNCYLCELSKGRKNTLFGYGNPQSKIVFVCDEPSIIEGEVGAFYAGKSGELLSKMIENVLNIKKEEIYITNLVKCKGVVEATISDFESCSCYFFKQLELISPKIIVAVGEKVYSFLLKNDSFIQNRGKALNLNKYIVIPIFSPVYLIKNPSLKKDTYLDMLKIKYLYEESR